MMKNGLLLPRKLLLFISMLGFVVIFLGAIFKITHMNYLGISANVLISTGTILSFITWIFVLIDVIRNKPQNWILWSVFLFIFGNITSIVYLLKERN